MQHASIDVALIRGVIPETAGVRQVHLFDEVRAAVCSEHSGLASHGVLDWTEVPQWPLVVNTVSGTTGPWSWPTGEGPKHIIETRNFDEWLESVAADRGIGVVPDVAMRRNIHSAVRFIPLTNAPPSAVSLAFLPHNHEPLMRQFVAAAISAVDRTALRSPGGGLPRRHYLTSASRSPAGRAVSMRTPVMANTIGYPVEPAKSPKTAGPAPYPAS